ncbi:MAG: cupin domain-containing protein [Thermodesulfobacteriota bacterium]|nr:cupin domain-containing protein [Thermodesulfobacteriota bacterium]
MTMTAEAIIEALEMKPHPEGGYYCETYRAADTITADALPKRFPDDRALGTAIYFLLPGGDVSCFHRLRCDELWHFYCGNPLVIHLLDPAGAYREIHLGPDIAAGERPQAVVPHAHWVGATVTEPEGFALVGCTTTPGFEFADFEMGGRNALLAAYPRHAQVITRLSYEL